MFSEKNPLSFGFFHVDFDWLCAGAEYARDAKRSKSFPEFWDHGSETPFFRVTNHMHVEFISAGFASILLLNTCPVAQIDVKGDYGIAEFFDLPPMTKDEWDHWELLGASTTRFEMEADQDHLRMLQIKEEEGRLNTLQMKRAINLSNGESSLSIHSAVHRLPCEPTLENLMDWIEVRAGTSHPLLLKHRYGEQNDHE